MTYMHSSAGDWEDTERYLHALERLVELKRLLGKDKITRADVEAHADFFQGYDSYDTEYADDDYDWFDPLGPWQEVTALFVLAAGVIGIYLCWRWLSSCQWAAAQAGPEARHSEAPPASTKPARKRTSQGASASQLPIDAVVDAFAAPGRKGAAFERLQQVCITPVHAGDLHNGLRQVSQMLMQALKLCTSLASASV